MGGCVSHPTPAPTPLLPSDPTGTSSKRLRASSREKWKQENMFGSPELNSGKNKFTIKETVAEKDKDKDKDNVDATHDAKVTSSPKRSFGTPTAPVTSPPIRSKSLDNAQEEQEDDEEDDEDDEDDDDSTDDTSEDESDSMEEIEEEPGSQPIDETLLTPSAADLTPHAPPSAHIKVNPIMQRSTSITRLMSRFHPENAHILIVDDDTLHQEAVAQWLALKKYHVTLCNDGEEAQQVLSEAMKSQVLEEDDARDASTLSTASTGSSLSNVQDFDCILCDSSMETREGRPFLDWVINTEAIAHIPVILMSSDATQQSTDRALRRGAEDFYRKPLIRSVLLKNLRIILENKMELKNSQKLKEWGDRYKEQLIQEKLKKNHAGNSSGLRLMPQIVDDESTMHNDQPPSQPAQQLTPEPEKKRLSISVPNNPHAPLQVVPLHLTEKPVTLTPPSTAISNNLLDATIMVVDPDEQNNQKITNWLTSQSFKVIVEKSCNDALNYLIKNAKTRKASTFMSRPTAAGPSAATPPSSSSLRSPPSPGTSAYTPPSTGGSTSKTFLSPFASSGRVAELDRAGSIALPQLVQNQQHNLVAADELPTFQNKSSITRSTTAMAMAPSQEPAINFTSNETNTPDFSSNTAFTFSPLKNNKVFGTQNVCDLIIADGDGNPSGSTFLQRIQDNLFTKNIPVILMYKDTAIEDVQKSLRLGVETVLSSPFSKDMLLKKVTQVLNTIAQKKKSEMYAERAQAYRSILSAFRTQRDEDIKSGKRLMSPSLMRKKSSLNSTSGDSDTSPSPRKSSLNKQKSHSRKVSSPHEKGNPKLKNSSSRAKIAHNTISEIEKNMEAQQQNNKQNNPVPEPTIISVDPPTQPLTVTINGNDPPPKSDNQSTQTNIVITNNNNNINNNDNKSNTESVIKSPIDIINSPSSNINSQISPSPSLSSSSIAFSVDKVVESGVEVSSVDRPKRHSDIVTSPSATTSSSQPLKIVRTNTGNNAVFRIIKPTYSNSTNKTESNATPGSES